VRSKYGAQKTVVDGITFDSKKEAKRYQELKLLERSGEISHLELQPSFKLFCGNEPIKFDSGRQAVYKADFAYFDYKVNRRVIEDAKGFRTPEYKLKRAIVHAMHPMVRIIEV
jgi:hypothetical protein